MAKSKLAIASFILPIIIFFPMFINDLNDMLVSFFVSVFSLECREFCGLLTWQGIYPLVLIISVIFAIISLVKIKRKKETEGKWFAIVGLIISVLEIMYLFGAFRGFL